MEYIWQNINNFAVSHDHRRIFQIIYIGGAAIIALGCGLFYFALWVALHYLLEIYKCFRISHKLKLMDFLLSFYHCRLDIMFLVIGLCIDVVSHQSFLLASANQEIRILAILRISRIESLGRFAKVAKIMPRLFGTVKASSCVMHLAEELSKNASQHKNSHIHIHIKIGDIIIFSLIILSLVLSFIIPINMGFKFSEVMHSILHVLTP